MILHFLEDSFLSRGHVVAKTHLHFFNTFFVIELHFQRIIALQQFIVMTPCQNVGQRPTLCASEIGVATYSPPAPSWATNPSGPLREASKPPFIPNNIAPIQHWQK